MRKIAIIAAMTKEQIIGQGNKMPWHIPEELQHFKAMTMGKPMIMGRATFDSIGRRLLPGRKTIILSQDPHLVVTGAVVVNTIEQALTAAGNAAEIMIVGGARVYQQFLPLANTMYLSILHKAYSGDVFFPNYDPLLWHKVKTKAYAEFTVEIFEKII